MRLTWNQPGNRQSPLFALGTQRTLGTSSYLLTSVNVGRHVDSFPSFVLYSPSFALFLFSVTNALASPHLTTRHVREDASTQGSANCQNGLASVPLQSRSPYPKTLNAAEGSVWCLRAARRSRDDVTVPGNITFRLTSCRSVQTPHYLRPGMTDRFTAVSITWGFRGRNKRSGLSGKARRGQTNYASVTGASLHSTSTAHSVLCQNSTDRKPGVGSFRLQ